jgi:hypothetical protein
MADAFADSTAELGRFVRRILTETEETDPTRYDELAAEIWRVLDERERLKGDVSDSAA